MSNKLKRKSKTKVGFNAKDKKIISASIQKASQEDKAIMSITNHISYITYIILADKFDFTTTRIKHFYEKVEDMKQRWADKEFSTSEMLVYCDKKKLDVYQFVKSIETSQMLKLLDGHTAKNIYNYAESGMLLSLLISVITLKEQYRFSKADIDLYLRYVKNYIVLYTSKEPGAKNYTMDDSKIADIFMEDNNLDIIHGMKIVKKKAV